MSGDRSFGSARDALGLQPDTGPDEEPDKVGDGLKASRPLKRSFSIAGHRTSISLEAAFWDAFRELCRADGVSMAAMLARIDRERGSEAGLSGAVRVWILQRYREGSGPGRSNPNQTD
ncbi:MAG: ribbon-helix-helix domain-containing protein [Hyphomicrobiaceae bacterium]